MPRRRSGWCCGRDGGLWLWRNMTQFSRRLLACHAFSPSIHLKNSPACCFGCFSNCSTNSALTQVCFCRNHKILVWCSVYFEVIRCFHLLDITAGEKTLYTYKDNCRNALKSQIPSVDHNTCWWTGEANERLLQWPKIEIKRHIAQSCLASHLPVKTTNKLSSRVYSTSRKVLRRRPLLVWLLYTFSFKNRTAFVSDVQKTSRLRFKSMVSQKQTSPEICSARCFLNELTHQVLFLCAVGSIWADAGRVKWISGGGGDLNGLVIALITWLTLFPRSFWAWHYYSRLHSHHRSRGSTRYARHLWNLLSVVCVSPNPKPPVMNRLSFVWISFFVVVAFVTCLCWCLKLAICWFLFVLFCSAFS